jgi:hypothetical protein
VLFLLVLLPLLPLLLLFSLSSLHCCLDACQGDGLLPCRDSQREIGDAGKWTVHDDGALGKSYNKGVDPNIVCRVCGWGDGHAPMQHYCPPQAALTPPKSVLAFVYPRVLKCHDGEVLNIIQALEHVRERQVCKVHSD